VGAWDPTRSVLGVPYSEVVKNRTLTKDQLVEGDGKNEDASK
jgi:hypothetical protein